MKSKLKNFLAFLMLTTFVFSTNVSFSQESKEKIEKKEAYHFVNETHFIEYLDKKTIKEIEEDITRGVLYLDFVKDGVLSGPGVFTYIKKNEKKIIRSGEIFKKEDLVFNVIEDVTYNNLVKFVFKPNYYDKGVTKDGVTIEDLNDYELIFEKFKSNFRLNKESTNFNIINKNFELTQTALDPTHRITSTAISVITAGIAMGMLSSGNPENIKSAGIVLGVGGGLSLLTYIVGEIKIYGINAKIQPLIK